VTASSGVANASGDGVSAGELLHVVDGHLYLAKKRGRNRCVGSGS